MLCSVFIGDCSFRHILVYLMAKIGLLVAFFGKIKGISQVQYKLSSINSICGIMLITKNIISTCPSF